MIQPAPRTAKDAGGAPFALDLVDQSGTGAGPFTPVHQLRNGAGALVDPATEETLATGLAQLEIALGADGITPPDFDGGATGIRGWLRQIWLVLTTGTIKAQAMTGAGPVSSANPMPVQIAADSVVLQVPATLAQDASVQALGQTIGGAGTGAAAPVLPSGATGLIGVVQGGLAAVVAKLAGTLAVTGTFYQPTQPVSAVALPLPAGAMTDTTGQAIKAALLAQIDLATSVWTDGTNYYVRRELLAEGTGALTVTFTNPDGSASAVAAAGLRPVASDNALTLIQTQFDLTGVGSGIAVGDVLARAIVLNKAVSPPVATAAVWLNLSQGTTLAAAPAAASIVEQTQHLAISSLPASVAQDASLQQIRTALVGAATACNQASEIAALGQLHADLTSTPQVAPARGAAVDVSKTSVAATSTILVPANAVRLAWTMMAPAGGDVWLNPTGGTAGPNLSGCFLVRAGTGARSTVGAVETNAITYWCATAGLMIPATTL